MLSIIICSKFQSVDAEFQRNISETVGCDYEIIHIDNSTNVYNIFQAYNKGVSLSHGEYLCFVHEDVEFHKSGWGHRMEQILSNSSIGAVGVAGGHYVATKLDWRFYGFGEIRLFQDCYTIEPESRCFKVTPKQETEKLIHVAVLDGVFICIRKELFKSIRWDDETFSDFHLYDSDICMQINSLGLDVFVDTDVFLEHKSEGTYSMGYIKSMNLFFDKWKDKLPLSIGMALDQKRIDKALDNAEKSFSKRLHQDIMLVKLREKFKLYRANPDSVNFTDEEIKIIDNSLFRFCKRIIKDKKQTLSSAWNECRYYIASPFSRRRNKMFRKFVWYRILNPNHKH